MRWGSSANVVATDDGAVTAATARATSRPPDRATPALAPNGRASSRTRATATRDPAASDPVGARSSRLNTLPSGISSARAPIGAAPIGWSGGPTGGKADRRGVPAERGRGEAVLSIGPVASPAPPEGGPIAGSEPPGLRRARDIGAGPPAMARTRGPSANSSSSRVASPADKSPTLERPVRTPIAASNIGGDSVGTPIAPTRATTGTAPRPVRKRDMAPSPWVATPGLATSAPGAPPAAACGTRRNGGER